MRFNARNKLNRKLKKKHILNIKKYYMETIKFTKAMETVIYEIPNSVKEMFEQGINSYRIIDYSIGEMNNIKSMQYFLDCIGATNDNIETDDGTQVVIIHPDFNHKLVIDSGGLGDSYSHGYDVTLYSETVSSALCTNLKSSNGVGGMKRPHLRLFKSVTAFMRLIYTAC